MILTENNLAPSYFEAKINVKNDDGNTTNGRWWDLWTGAVAINTLCIKNAQAGIASFPGGLVITINSYSPKTVGNPLEKSNLTGATETC